MGAKAADLYHSVMAARGGDQEFAQMLRDFVALRDRLGDAVLAEPDTVKAFAKAGQLLDAASGARGFFGQIRARVVARAWHASDMTYVDLGEKLGISRQRVNQLMRVARESGDA